MERRPDGTDRELVDLTEPGRYSLASESPDERRYQFPAWLIAAGAAFLLAAVLAMVLFA
jgi:hypothetical protein